MSDCERCRNYKECISENKDKVDKCFFVYPTEEYLAKDTKEYAIGYKQGISDERERIVEELEEKKHKVYSTYSLSENNIDLGITYGLEKAIEILRGGNNERNE